MSKKLLLVVEVSKRRESLPSKESIECGKHVESKDESI